MMRKVELRYGELALQRVDVFCREEEEEETSFHLLVFVHGGLWTNGDKSQHVQLAHLLCRPNWRVAVCNYRLSDPKSENPVMAPEHTNDVARCLCFLHASLRPKRVVLVGQSCGAHMAALICSGVCEPRVAELPELVVAVQGMFSNRQFVREYPEWKPEVDRSQGSDESKWIDPIAEHCTKSEWLLIHSPSDPWVKAEQSRVFASAILAAGGRAVLDEEERGKHFASVRDDEAEIKKLAERIQRAMVGLEDSLEGRDEARRLANAGFREGRELGVEKSAQESFSRGFKEGATQGMLVGERLGFWHTQEQLGAGDEPRKDDLIEVMEEDRQLTEAELNKFLH